MGEGGGCACGAGEAERLGHALRTVGVAAIATNEIPIARIVLVKVTNSLIDSLFKVIGG